MNVRRLALSTSLALGLLGSNAAYAFQDATPVGGPMGAPPMPEGCSVIADGLINPRYVAVGDDGTIYVSEAGVGGDESVAPPVDPIATPDPGASPAAVEMEEMPPGTRGMSGQLTTIAPDGTQSTLVTGLPSYASGIEVTGPAGVAVDAEGQIILAVGGAGPATAFTDPLENENSVLSVDPATGAVTPLADIGAYERAVNPEPFNIDSNLYGVDVASDGTIYVNDAGGNATYRVPAGGGDPQVVVVHPGIPVPDDQAPPGGNPFRGGANELDPVPTGILVSDDGTIFTGYLSGGPFPPGAAKVAAIAPDGTVTDIAMGLTMVVDMAIGPDGHMYVTQFSMNLLGEIPEPGNVVRVLEDGTQEVVVDGLMLPNGIAFDQDGNLLVVTNAVSMGPPTGQLLSCEGVSMGDAADVITVELSDMQFSPSSVSIPANSDVTVRLVNSGFATHNISIPELGITSKMLAAGEEMEVIVNAPAGTYAFRCDVPGHQLAGMVGSLRVG